MVDSAPILEHLTAEVPTGFGRTTSKELKVKCIIPVCNLQFLEMELDSPIKATVASGVSSHTPTNLRFGGKDN